MTEPHAKNLFQTTTYQNDSGDFITLYTAEGKDAKKTTAFYRTLRTYCDNRDERTCAALVPTLLQMASDPEIDPNAYTQNEISLLTLAATFAPSVLVKRLLRHPDIDINAKHKGMSALEFLLHEGLPARDLRTAHFEHVQLPSLTNKETAKTLRLLITHPDNRLLGEALLHHVPEGSPYTRTAHQALKHLDTIAVCTEAKKIQTIFETLAHEVSRQISSELPPRKRPILETTLGDNLVSALDQFCEKTTQSASGRQATPPAHEAAPADRQAYAKVFGETLRQIWKTVAFQTTLNEGMTSRTANKAVALGLKALERHTPAPV